MNISKYKCKDNLNTLSYGLIKKMHKKNVHRKHQTAVSSTDYVFVFLLFYRRKNSSKKLHEKKLTATTATDMVP